MNVVRECVFCAVGLRASAGTAGVRPEVQIHPCPRQRGAYHLTTESTWTWIHDKATPDDR